ncbi:hypothetical protein FHS27_006280 [Rhodopirellula rubra]|uniref:Uncharacterized protein n=1 Tax=Aporhodopirellula rubra TaxID=980271 RepID=A0A7W5E6E9_9BACT|nr:hypothetical protein [Aporhodopirellula rubra]MBB3210433.1 hypothetical protein [Aporhodopirellula rubra]
MRTRVFWIVHIITLVGVALWAALDLRFESLAFWPSSSSENLLESMQANVKESGLIRVFGFASVLLLALITIAVPCVRLFRFHHGSRARSTASLLAITTVTALWCGIVINHSALAWQGKRARIAIQVNELEHLAAPLRNQWPARDGDLPGVGPFMAYPFGRPTTLILLQSPNVAGDELCIAAVEGNESGPIRMQLSGSAHDDWAEWHPDSSRPQSFVGGLGDPHQLVSATKLGRGWYLVRYTIPDALSHHTNNLELAANG